MTSKQRWDRTNPEDRDPRGKWYAGKPTLKERLFGKITINAVTECWEWTAAKSSNGYGLIRVGGKKGRTIIASRVSYELKYGPIPEGLHVCHSCDNPPCINPDHLFIGTRADNAADMVAKGRQAHNRGAESGRAKLTEDDIRAIRSANGITIRKLGKIFGVSHCQIVRIKSGQSWAHIGSGSV